MEPTNHEMINVIHLYLQDLAVAPVVTGKDVTRVQAERAWQKHFAENLLRKVEN